MQPRQPGICGITRRGFLLGAGTGLAAGGPLGWYAYQGFKHLEHQSQPPARAPLTRVPEGMPGKYPGRVIEVNHPGSVNSLHLIHRPTVKAMLDRGMCELTGSDDVAEAWRSFFAKDDVVGIKLNPVGRAPKPNEPGRVRNAVGSISNPEVALEIVAALKNYVGMPGRNIILFERYADEFRNTGYDKLVNERGMEGVHWYASAHAYDETQVLISGQNGPGRDPNVVGYDPDHYVTMGFCNRHHDPKDDRRFRSHLSMIVTRMTNKIITIPVLKDHKSAGVTLALKNMSHGMNNNVSRSHLSGFYRRDGVQQGPNQCNTFIPTAVNQPALREKAALHILDGLIAVYEGGPGSWNRTWGTWPQRSLFFATDPVAMDHVGWQIIDQKRQEVGWAPVGNMGLIQGGPSFVPPPQLTASLLTSPPEAALAMYLNHLNRERTTRVSEPFDRRQPEHIILAGLIGLGVWDPAGIHHRHINLTA